MFIDAQKQGYNKGLRGLSKPKFTQESIEKFRKGAEKRAKKVHTPLGDFPSIWAATRAHNFRCSSSIQKKVLSRDPKYNEFYFVADGPKIQTKTDKAFIDAETHGYNKGLSGYTRTRMPDSSYEKRTDTMKQRYGKGSVGPKSKYTFGENNLSAKQFMEQNKQLVMKMVDRNHNKPYHKIHKWLIENCTSQVPPHRVRTDTIGRFVRYYESQ